MQGLRPSALELWAALTSFEAGEPAFLRVEVDGAPVYLPADGPRRFDRIVNGAAQELLEVRVSAGLFVGNWSWRDDPADRTVRARYVPGPSNVLWCRVEDPAGRERLECFAPAPTLVLADGAARTALWALQQPLSRGWTDQLNLRLAHRVGGKKAHAGAWFDFSPGGTVARQGRRRPVQVEVVSWSGETHSAKAVAGNLDDPADPRAAWKARQAAA